MDKICRTLAVAVATKRIAGVFLENGQVVGWRMSRKATKNPKDAAMLMKSWIDDFDPDLMISEEHRASRKGDHAKVLLETIGDVFDKAEGLNVRLPRVQVYQDKYEEAKILAEQYPKIAALLPKKPPIWKAEPFEVSYFEALSLVEQLNA